ncbi:DUF1553 domain-containing protein [Planctomicrobium sp. SH661]|uniref:DUF1553 domain-containing protein n=1 Tax=Planctomicrobium sp. SH661 TaxID=3448124 RepID=UPI003F5C8521
MARQCLLLESSLPKQGRLHILMATLAFVLAPPLYAKDLDYNRDVRPILADKCFICHGPDHGNRQAELRLDTAEGAYAALSSDAALVAIRPGDPSHSEVYKRLTTDDPDQKMPPASSNLSLSAEQIATIRKWIEQGAVYQPHWAFLAPQKSQVPEVPNDRWVQNEIDAFVLQKMLEQGLKPNPPATREQLIRRVTFDLTGLPPTLQEIDAFVEDQSPDAFERVVDRLLSSERFGERMASEWLDVARYSDTYGFQVDHERFVWPWRDWVIRAFNRDLPFDEFMTQQLAGDLLPDATQEQILATTFCRLHPQEAEGGSIPEEYRTGYVSDRLQTFSTAFLGLTVECCKCHDHKYDPISQREYFEMASFFDNIDESGLYSFFTRSIPTPTLLLTDENSEKTLAEHKEKCRQLEQALVELPSSRVEAFRSWRASKPAAPEKVNGELAHLNFDTVHAPNQPVPGPVGQAIQLTGDDAVPLDVGNFTRSQPFSVTLWMKTPDVKERSVVFHRSRGWMDAGSRGYELMILDGHLSFALVHFDPGNSIRVKSPDPFPVDAWHHVAVTYDGSSQAPGVSIYIDGKPIPVEIVRDQLTKEITGGGGDNITIGERFRDHGFKQGQVDEFRVFNRKLLPVEVAELHDFHSLKDAFASDASASPEQDSLWKYYLENVDPEYQAALAALQQARQASADYIETIPEIMAMRETSEARQTYILTRGEYALRAEPVSSDTPAIFPEFSEELPRNRLGLARWMASPEHPLTSRVTVNRYWQLLFGTGLVRTTEDLGNQGEWPSHPELFDWLSRDFMEQGWSVKKLLKQMVMTSTYQQSATVTDEKEAIDPANKWLSRAMSERFTAEMLRDNALAVSGLLVDKIGGPPVKPYEVEVAFKPLPRDTGEGLYRRSLYTYWNRTGPAPVMMALDAAKRDVCQVRRERTLSPLQPLVLLNGPQFVEAARMLAQRVMLDHPGDQKAVLVDMFRWTTSRRPSAEELDVINTLYEQHLSDFSAHPEQAVAFLAVGDAPRNETLDPAQLAAMAGVANLLLNFDDCVFRR